MPILEETSCKIFFMSIITAKNSSTAGNLRSELMASNHPPPKMNGVPLPAIYGAPLRLRVENQLGYKMIKWIEPIEFKEDDEHFDLLPNI
jgi:hypothetical protein